MQNLGRLYTNSDFDCEYLRNESLRISKIGKTCDSSYQLIFVQNIDESQSFTIHCEPMCLWTCSVIGCARPVSPPVGGWMQLVSDDVIISGCNASSLGHVRQQMRCDGSRWTGEFINCTTTLARQSLQQTERERERERESLFATYK